MRLKYGKGEGEHFCHNNFTFSSIGVSAAPVEVLPRSPGTGVPGALPPDDDCLALSFFLFSLTVDRWLLNSFSFLSRFSEFILRILKFRINHNCFMCSKIDIVDCYTPTFALIFNINIVNLPSFTDPFIPIFIPALIVNEIGKRIAIFFGFNTFRFIQ